MSEPRKTGPKPGFKHREETIVKMRRSAAELWAERRKLMKMGRQAQEMMETMKGEG